MNSLRLKWGTVKGWDVDSDEALEALQKWVSFGVTDGCAARRANAEQQQALLDAIDFMDEIYLEWDGKYVTREEAKDYIRNYGKR